MRVFIIALALAACLALVAGDCYMHNPRGSNDRCRETNTNRNNANRLFNSQNNAKGGYCWGPALTYYASSRLSIEWTAQHGCGANPRMYCNMVIQYMCEDKDADAFHKIRDGTTTDTIPDDSNGPTAMDGNDYEFGMHEPYEWYQACKSRNRNKGLFIADREEEGGLNDGRADSRFTRQNNNGNRHGYECPEERDYYPYWAPTPWKDVAILTHDTDWCGYYKSESQNKKDRYQCWDTAQEEVAPPITKGECEATPGWKWKKVGSWGIPAPACEQAPISRENHLGHGYGVHNNFFNWTLPTDSEEGCIKGDKCDCVLRIRYNISTGDLGKNGNRPDKKFIDLKSNAAKSPVYQDDIVKVEGLSFLLAVDTTQYGRTFQDRSHVFHIQNRPKDVPKDSRIFNLNVRGKRGNIVQTYPSTEYDFTPSYLNVKVNDYIHFHWTGCDYNPAGNAGEGTDGTDRSNIVQVSDSNKNYPASEGWLNSNTKLFPDKDVRKRMAYLDQTGCLNYTELLDENGGNQGQAEQDSRNCMLLNAAPTPYFDGGLQQMKSTGTFHYMSTRNNNHSNRDQKGTIVVDPLLPIWAIALLVVGSVLFVGSAGVAGAMFYAKGHPHSQVANVLSKF